MLLIACAELQRTKDRFGLKLEYVVADSAYGPADNLAWLVKEKKIAPDIPVFDKTRSSPPERSGKTARSFAEEIGEADIR